MSLFSSFSLSLMISLHFTWNTSIDEHNISTDRQTLCGKRKVSIGIDEARITSVLLLSLGYLFVFFCCFFFREIINNRKRNKRTSLDHRPTEKQVNAISKQLEMFNLKRNDDRWTFVATMTNSLLGISMFPCGRRSQWISRRISSSSHEGSVRSSCRLADLDQSLLRHCSKSTDRWGTRPAARWSPDNSILRLRQAYRSHWDRQSLAGDRFRLERRECSYRIVREMIIDLLNRSRSSPARLIRALRNFTEP